MIENWESIRLNFDCKQTADDLLNCLTVNLELASISLECKQTAVRRQLMLLPADLH